MAALGTKRLPHEWFDALVDFEEQIAGVEYQVNADRAEAAFMARQR